MSPMVRTMRIIWAAQLVVPVIFLGVLFQLRSTGEVAKRGEPLMLLVFGVLAVVLVVMSFVLPTKLRAAATKNAKLDITEEVVEDEAQVFRQPARTQRVFTDRRVAVRSAAHMWMSPWIVGMALLEATAIHGLVLGMLGFGLIEVVPFFAVAWVLMALRCPTERQMVASLEKECNAVLPPE